LTTAEINANIIKRRANEGAPEGIIIEFMDLIE
jgi:hypothetical protein